MSSDESAPPNSLGSLLQLPIQISHERLGSKTFAVLRDDRIPGGTKTRVLRSILPQISESGIVYPAHPYGYGAEALGVACREEHAFRTQALLANKDASATSHNAREVVLIYPAHGDGKENGGVNSEFPRPMRRAVMLPNVTFFVQNRVSEQKDLDSIAMRYAAEYEFFHMPIGFALDSFKRELIRLIRDDIPGVTEYREIWVIAGSGLLARALSEALPKAEINVVDLGMPHCDTGGLTTYRAKEKVNEPASVLPPFPSASYYDAKLWRHVVSKASDGALVWNVGG